MRSELWFSTFLMLRPLIVSHAVLTPLTALLYCCIIAVILLVMNGNVISDVQAINM